MGKEPEKVRKHLEGDLVEKIHTASFTVFWVSKIDIERKLIELFHVFRLSTFQTNSHANQKLFPLGNILSFYVPIQTLIEESNSSFRKGRAGISR